MKKIFQRHSRVAKHKVYGPHDWSWRLAQRLPNLWWGLVWEPRDVWVGVYWTTTAHEWPHGVDIYVCVLPCLPFVFNLRWSGLHPWTLREDDIPF